MIIASPAKTKIPPLMAPSNVAAGTKPAVDSINSKYKPVFS
jgi:hypothetical protein